MSASRQLPQEAGALRDLLLLHVGLDNSGDFLLSVAHQPSAMEGLPILQSQFHGVCGGFTSLKAEAGRPALKIPLGLGFENQDVKSLG